MWPVATRVVVVCSTAFRVDDVFHLFPGALPQADVFEPVGLDN